MQGKIIMIINRYTIQYTRYATTGIVLDYWSLTVRYYTTNSGDVRCPSLRRKSFFPTKVPLIVLVIIKNIRLNNDIFFGPMLFVWYVAERIAVESLNKTDNRIIWAIISSVRNSSSKFSKDRINTTPFSHKTRRIDYDPSSSTIYALLLHWW